MASPKLVPTRLARGIISHRPSQTLQTWGSGKPSRHLKSCRHGGQVWRKTEKQKQEEKQEEEVGEDDTDTGAHEMDEKKPSPSPKKLQTRGLVRPDDQTPPSANF